ncbi:MAG TPA: hypothetical protein VNX02_05940 [Steroidobacteraceae bacterium]|nr:hypothetical protein [Steroidobacteraceae bacterium]
MKYAVITLLLVASTGTTVAVAQEGNGHGPPTAPTTVPTPVPQPTVPTSTGTPKSASAFLGTSLNEIGPAISTARESRRRGLRLV